MNDFDDRAASWDTPERIERAAMVAAAIRAAIPLGPGTRVLEVGAGTGLLGRSLAPWIGSVLLADASAGMVAAAAEAAEASGAANVRAVLLDLMADPPPAGSFDLVVSLMALHHLPDTGAALARMAELLEPGGRIAIADLDAEDGSFHDDPDERARVHHGFDRSSLRAGALAAGFVEIDFASAPVITRNGRPYPLFLLVARRP